MGGKCFGVQEKRRWKCLQRVSKKSRRYLVGYCRNKKLGLEERKRMDTMKFRGQRGENSPCPMSVQNFSPCPPVNREIRPAPFTISRATSHHFSPLSTRKQTGGSPIIYRGRTSPFCYSLWTLCTDEISMKIRHKEGGNREKDQRKSSELVYWSTLYFDIVLIFYSCS